MADQTTDNLAESAVARQRYVAAARSVVVKLGTQLLSDKARRLDTAFIATMATQIARLRAAGKTVTVVSSGAVGAGIAELNLPARPTDLAVLQAVAAVGQRRLMDAWAAAFAPHGIHVAQILLTREDIDHRTRYLNLRNTLSAVHGLGAIPIINENDTVSTDEMVRITFGDNDVLASLVAHAIRADLLVLLSVVDGLLDAGGKPVRLVESIDKAAALVKTEKSAMGKGGMSSKLLAAKTLADAGEAMVIADGRGDEVLSRICAGGEVGTLFLPASRKRSSRSRWIGSVRTAGSVTIDAGAVKALVEKGRSLLPAGVVGVEGEFDPGDPIAILADGGKQPIARGLTNYAADTVRQIMGKKSADVRALLGPAAYDEVVHRDNLVVER